MAGIIGSLIGAAGGLAQSIIEGGQQRRNIDMQNKANMAMSEYQYGKDLEMWNRQNEYNSPESQMARFNAAGLNPNLIYGQGSPGNATVLPRYNAPQLSYNYKPGVNISDALQQYMDFTVKNAQVDNLKAQKKVIDAQGTIKGSEAFFADWINRLKSKKLVSENQLMDIIKDWQGTALPGMEVYPKGNAYIGYGASDLLKGQKLYELGKTQAQVQGLELDNELKQKTINWYIADKLAKYAAGAIGAFGIGRLGKIARQRPGNTYQPGDQGKLKRKTTSYYE